MDVRDGRSQEMFEVREFVSYWPRSRMLAGLDEHLKAGTDRNGTDRNGKPHSNNSKGMDLDDI